METMHDPEFQQPVAKFPGTPDAGSAPAPAPTCKLAVVSLVFGILGYAPLPFLGALVAIVTGHIALGEIRDSGGRLGGRSAAKAGLVLGYIWFLLLILAGAVVLWFMTVGFGPRTEAITPRAVRVPSGFKMANQMSQRDLENLKRLGLGDGPDEEIIASYSNATPTDEEPETAVLTTKRIAYLKGDRLTSFDLKDVDSILEGDRYEKKYTPNYHDVTRYMIVIKRRTGGRMRIAIEPARDGPSFSEALQDAWKAAGGKPEEAAKK